MDIEGRLLQEVFFHSLITFMLRRDSTTWRVVLGLCETVEEIAGIAAHGVSRPRVAMTMDRYEFAQMRAGVERAEWAKAMYELQRKKLLKIDKKAEKAEISFTEKGRTEVLKVKIAACKDRLPSGQSCLVAFDIPERAAKIRYMFRKFLKQSGFMQHQRSVWMSPYNVSDDLRQLVKRFKAEDWISVYTVV